MARTFKRIGYDRGAYHAQLFEHGKYLRLVSWAAPYDIANDADRGVAYWKVRLLRDRELRAWVSKGTLPASAVQTKKNKE